MKRSMYLISGGRQNDFSYKLKEWSGYDRGILLQLEINQGKISLLNNVEYLTEDKYLPETEQSVTFKSGSLYGDTLWLSTQTEAVSYNTRSLEQQEHCSLPQFNDVHHVMKTTNDTLLIVSTGLDAVFEVDKDDNIINEFYCLEGDMWQKFDRNKDYRKVATTKPHQSHPNFCFEYDKQYYVTRLKQQDCLCLQTGETIELGVGPIHDGIVEGEFAYFTHVNGFISKVSMKLKTVVECYDMNVANTSVRQLGWCRGLCKIDEHRFIVGFTRIRPSKMQLGLEWIKNQLPTKGWQGSEPTRIALFNSQSQTFEWQTSVEGYAINALFSIIAIDK